MRLESFRTPEGILYLDMNGTNTALYFVKPDGSYNPKAKEIAEAFNRGECTLEYNGHVYKKIKEQESNNQELTEQNNKNKKTSFWRKLFGLI